jgi:phosphatidate phosphatase APP1
LPPSAAAGQIVVNLTLPDGQVATLAHDDMIAFQSVPTARNVHRFHGHAVVVPAEGSTVVTDMDDTIKATNMRNRAEDKANTFMRPFCAVAGMAALYRARQAGATEHLHFHVVSAESRQFHEPLRQFTEAAGLPEFTRDMRTVDVIKR